MAERNFTPAWWLPGPHLQTMWGKWARRTPLPRVTQLKLRTEDDDEVSIVRLAATSDEAPRILFLHGLEGTTDSHYVRGCFSEAASRGWGVDVLLFRTCDGRLNAAPRTYHSGETSDPAFVLKHAIEWAGAAPLALVGVSLGGNVLLRLLAGLSMAESSRVTAAVAISTPYDLARSCRHLQTGSSRLYQWHFVRKLRRKALAKVAQHPGIASSAAIARARTFWEFDDAFTSVVHGFRDAADYYQRCSSISVLQDITVPTLLLSARDDPFHPPELLDDVAARAATNPALNIEFLPQGGHVGFVSGSPLKPRYYAEWRAAEFIATHCRVRDESIDQRSPLAAR
ncbi:MAG: YheT family hydrolase [Gemmatimonadaceae bacterium]